MVQMGNSAEEGENPSQEEKTTMLVKDKEDGYEGELQNYYLHDYNLSLRPCSLKARMDSVGCDGKSLM